MSTSTDGAGEVAGAGPPNAGEDAGQHQRTGDEADLALEIPAGAAAVEVAALPAWPARPSPTRA